MQHRTMSSFTYSVEELDETLQRDDVAPHLAPLGLFGLSSIILQSRMGFRHSARSTPVSAGAPELHHKFRKNLLALSNSASQVIASS
jgi:hypothetical protein